MDTVGDDRGEDVDALSNDRKDVDNADDTLLVDMLLMMKIV